MWMIIHSQIVEDLLSLMNERDEFVGWLRKHADDELGPGYRKIIKTIDKQIAELKAEYRRKYGCNFSKKVVIQPS